MMIILQPIISAERVDSFICIFWQNNASNVREERKIMGKPCFEK